MNAGAPPPLAAQGITLRYPRAAGPVLAGFDLAVGQGEVVTIIGPSGVGKSSLLRVLGGLQRPTAGEVAVAGEPIRDVHPRVAVAFQNPCLLPWLTLERNVAFGLDFKRQARLTRTEARRRVDAAIAEVGLSHARRLHPPALSGGMAQRAALARCLARTPHVLLLDEPFGALDEVTRAGMQQLLLKVVADFGTAVVLITHDLDEALLVSDRIVLIGGAPAGELCQWRVDLPKPRDDEVAALGGLRVDILRALRQAVPDQAVPDQAVRDQAVPHQAIPRH